MTPKGKIAIEKLHLSDRLIGYNFKTHQEEISKVKNISEISSLSYYLINNQIKIAGTNYVDIKTSNNPKIIRVYQL